MSQTGRRGTNRRTASFKPAAPKEPEKTPQPPKTKPVEQATPV